jgi:uncharacterized protein YjbJ (UPF0337 family)
MSERTFDSLGDNVQGHIQEAAGKMTGDEELEAKGKRLRTEAEGVEQDTETNADGEAQLRRLHPPPQG